MNLENRKKAFIDLGLFLKQFSENEFVKNNDIAHNDIFYDAFSMQIKRSKEHNSWFTKENVCFSLLSWSKCLTKENLDLWLDQYYISENKNPKTVAVIMAGNIPLVGFHDFLSVLMSGNHIIAKLSSSDKYFLPLIAKYLEYLDPYFKKAISFSERLESFDAVIATGSGNTSRYFDYYFKDKPSVIRRNRNAVAVLSGKETPEQLEAMADDIFKYFGLGCRSISKIFLPKGYDLDLLFKAIYKYNYLLDYDKYRNNYDYNKAVYLMSLFDIRENGFFMLKEDKSYSSPIASLFYEYYDDIEVLEQQLTDDKDKIQCITSEMNIVGAIGLGDTQKPSLSEYADGVDTMDFLLSLNITD